MISEEHYHSAKALTLECLLKKTEHISCVLLERKYKTPGHENPIRGDQSLSDRFLVVLAVSKALPFHERMLQKPPWAVTSLEGSFKRGWEMVEGSISVTAERAVYKGICLIASTEPPR